MGVIVGAVVGAVVFIILMTILTCVKFKKRRIHRQQENGKINGDHNSIRAASEALTPTLTDATVLGAGGPLGGYHHNNHNSLNHNPYHHHHQGGTLTRINGNGNGSSQGHMSPEFLTYRHYSIATDNGVGGGVHTNSIAASTEMDRLWQENLNCHPDILPPPPAAFAGESCIWVVTYD